MEYVHNYPNVTTASVVFMSVAILLIMFDAPFVKYTETNNVGVPVRVTSLQNVAMWAAALTLLWWALPWLSKQWVAYNA